MYRHNCTWSKSDDLNLKEDESQYTFTVELPGVEKDKCTVEYDNGVLTISGERKTKEEVKEEDYYKVETYFGKFSRSFTLPDNADIENIEASSENGVLEVIIPKLKDDTTKKTIAIK